MHEIFEERVAQQQYAFKVKFTSYKFLHFFRQRVWERYGVRDGNFAKKHKTVLRHAFTVGALAIRNTMTGSQTLMREKGDDIGEYMQKMLDANP